MYQSVGQIERAQVERAMNVGVSAKSSSADAPVRSGVRSASPSSLAERVALGAVYAVSVGSLAGFESAATNVMRLLLDDLTVLIPYVLGRCVIDERT